MPEEYETTSEEGTAQVESSVSGQPSSGSVSGGGTGLDSNVAGALCYALGLITGIIFLVMEKEDDFVRFHAMQSIVVSVALLLVSVVLGIVPILGWILAFLINIGSLILWLLLMYKAYQGEEWEVPVLGKIAREQMNKV
ncbi:MAG: DUF4870 domain-containing protein [Patescibacteria group bacterium]